MADADTTQVESLEDQPEELQGYRTRRGKLSEEPKAPPPPHHAAHEPGPVEKAKSWVNDLKQGHDRRMLAAQEERKTRAEQKLKSESERFNVVKTETQARHMSEERQRMERENIPLIGGLLAGSNRAREAGPNPRYKGFREGRQARVRDTGSPMQQALRGGFSGGGSRSSAPMGNLMSGNNRAESRSPLMASLSGQSTEPRRKPKYVNFVQHGRIVRVDVNNQPSPNTQQEARSPLQLAMFGGGNAQETRSPMLTVLTGGSSGKSAQSPLQRAMSGSKNSQGRLGRMLLGRR